jgi:hypothetical protein
MIADFTAVIGISLLLGCGASLAARRFDLPRAARIGIVVATGAAAMLPLGGLMLAGYLRAAVGDLSIVTQGLLAIAVVQYASGKAYLATRERTAIAAAVVAGAIFLYPAALGLTYFDPYALGYGSPWFAASLLALALGAWYLRLEWLMALILLAVVARLGNALESRNLWDYLVDPWLVLYALLWLIFIGIPWPDSSSVPRRSPRSS